MDYKTVKINRQGTLNKLDKHFTLQTSKNRHQHRKPAEQGCNSKLTTRKHELANRSMNAPDLSPTFLCTVPSMLPLGSFSVTNASPSHTCSVFISTIYKVAKKSWKQDQAERKHRLRAQLTKERSDRKNDVICQSPKE